MCIKWFHSFFQLFFIIFYLKTVVTFSPNESFPKPSKSVLILLYKLIPFVLLLFLSLGIIICFQIFAQGLNSQKRRVFYCSMKFLSSFLIASFCLFAIEATLINYRELFKSFVHKYEKSYSPIEFYGRFNIFIENVDFINNYNSYSYDSNFVLGINQYTDRTRQEFNMLLGYDTSNPPKIDPDQVKLQAIKANLFTKSFQNTTQNVPYINWIEKHRVGPVRNQKNCGSCYAMAATVSLASRHAIQFHDLIVNNLSVQQILDCSSDYGNKSCSGGTPENSYDYLIHQSGSCSELNYPYLGFDTPFCGLCIPMIFNLKSLGSVYTPGPDALIQELQNGPFVVAIDGSSNEFAFYKSGIFTACTPSKGITLSHAVTLVGYILKDGQNVFILRNSFGDWGENGNIYVPVGQNCLGMEKEAAAGFNVFPIFK